MAPAPPSQDDLEGYWGPPTSTLDWCEENYVTSYYVAEWWNTLSNLFMIVLPIISSVYMWKENVEMRFIWANLGLLVVGIGSWCFHMTLLYGMQLLDELPMVWGSIVMVYISFESCEKPGNLNTKLLTALFIYCLLITIIYLTAINPLIHQVGYGFLVVLLVGRGIYMLRYYGKHKNKFLYAYCLGLYVFAFFLWNIDNNLCTSVRSLRNSLPFPLSAVTQLHGWWHIMAGTSTHCFVILMCNFRSNYLRRENKLEYTAGLIPFVRHPVKGYEMNHNM
ncbi:alkaline ceramidase 3-like [Lytechinus variegatus]|uniref:alkaline ceramidase 3-like n=1 Tax=Lytechinus variegatus TaxID=7654 RepID=UPI001BB166C4|nr:alkaline ceramidase 3-like [Lytechinus variegatus]